MLVDSADCESASISAVILKQRLAYLPMAMSLAALALVALYVVFVGTARQADEGLAAHLWQVLMAGQLPLIAAFALRTPENVARPLWRRTKPHRPS